MQASQKVVMRYFPELTFKIDDSVDKQMRIADLLQEISQEREERESKEKDHLSPENSSS